MSRKTVAEDLALKDGKDWSKLDAAGKHGYLHYADVVIRNESRPVAEGGARKKLGHSHEPIEPDSFGKILEDGELVGHPDGEGTYHIEESSAPEEPPEEKLIPELKPGQYLCSQCNTPHRETSKIGKKHLQYKAV